MELTPEALERLLATINAEEFGIPAVTLSPDQHAKIQVAATLVLLIADRMIQDDLADALVAAMGIMGDQFITAGGGQGLGVGE